jgi:hypothetical protein
VSREERIDKAMKQLRSDKAKKIFWVLARDNPEMSVFWRPAEGEKSATLEDDNINITIEDW